MMDWKPMTANKKRLKEGMEKIYQSIAIEAQKPKVSCLPKDWRNRVIGGNQ